jgi:uncharacterized protein YndB with AHSA1/START domain
MKTVVVTTLIDAQPRQVFAAIADPHKPFLTSNPFTHLEIAGDKLAGVGTVYRWIFTMPLGLLFQFDEVVTEWVEHERFSYRAISGWSMEATNQLTPQNDRTCITFSLRYVLPGIGKWLIPRWLVRLGIQRSIANLKRNLEQSGGK